MGRGGRGSGRLRKEKKPRPRARRKRAIEPIMMPAIAPPLREEEECDAEEVEVEVGDVVGLVVALYDPGWRLT